MPLNKEKNHQSSQGYLKMQARGEMTRGQWTEESKGSLSSPVHCGSPGGEHVEEHSILEVLVQQPGICAWLIPPDDELGRSQESDFQL